MIMIAFREKETYLFVKTTNFLEFWFLPFLSGIWGFEREVIFIASQFAFDVLVNSVHEWLVEGEVTSYLSKNVI